MKFPRDETLHKLRHHRKAGVHGGARRSIQRERAAIDEGLADAGRPAWIIYDEAGAIDWQYVIAALDAAREGE